MRVVGWVVGSTQVYNSISMPIIFWGTKRTSNGIFTWSDQGAWFARFI